MLFGSAVLYLHGLRDDVGDIDVFVSRRVWGMLLGYAGSLVRTPRAGDPPLLERATDPPLHVFYEWTARDADWITAAECFATAEDVRGWRCASLATIRKQKLGSYAANPGSVPHEKHGHDLALIDLRLAGKSEDDPLRI